MEECAEVSEQCSALTVRVSKALRFGLNEVQKGQLLSNMQRISIELNDLRATSELLEQKGIVNFSQLLEKKHRLAYFIAVAKNEGIINE
jgi:hypothetical protein